MENKEQTHTEKKLLLLVAQLKTNLNVLKTQPVAHEKQNTFCRGYNDGYESAIEFIENFYIHKLEDTQ